MGQPRTRKPKPHETVLQTIFVKRVKQELEDRNLSVLQFSKLTGAPPERTLADVLRAGAVPRLTVVYQCAVALDVPVVSLLLEKSRQETPTNVRKLPERYKEIFATQHEDRTGSKKSKRNPSRS